MSHAYIPGLSTVLYRTVSKGLASKNAQMPGKGPKRKEGLEIFGEGPYPHSMNDFIGQETARLQIIAAMTAAVQLHKPMDHMLLASGQPGIGKTTLAKLVAFHLGAGIVELAGLVGDREVKLALHQMRDGDVLFLDEVHRLVNRGKSRAEWLLTLLQDGELVTPTGVVQAPAITVIAATTDAQALPETILDRFPLKPVLDPYSDEEAALIALSHAKRMRFGDMDKLPLPKQTLWLTDVARACNNNPRRMSMLLTSLRDIALSSNPPLSPRGYDISLARHWQGLTEDGLDVMAQGYLTGLYGNGGVAGVNTIKALLNEEKIAHTEKLLIQKGMITIGSKGRELTGMGMDRAQQLCQAAIDAMQDVEQVAQ